MATLSTVVEAVWEESTVAQDHLCSTLCSHNARQSCSTANLIQKQAQWWKTLLTIIQLAIIAWMESQVQHILQCFGCSMCFISGFLFNHQKLEETKVTASTILDKIKYSSECLDKTKLHISAYLHKQATHEVIFSHEIEQWKVKQLIFRYCVGLDKRLRLTCSFSC